MRRDARWRQGLRWTLLAAAVALYAVHFVHLTADPAGGDLWQDWSRFTDEGWYSDAAVRHFTLGHWYLPGEFNPGVAMPMWPLLEAAVFAVTGVSLGAARALAVGMFGVTLGAVWLLIERCAALRWGGERRDAGLAAPLAVLLLTASPLAYVFEREAILEPLLTALGVLALLTASHVGPTNPEASGWRGALRQTVPASALGLVVAAALLTKPTALALLPAVGWMVWGGCGFRWRPAARAGMVAASVAAGIWVAYFALYVRPRYLEDFRYVFSANAYTSFATEPLGTVLSATVADGRWMGTVLYGLFFALTGVLLFARPGWFRNPLVPSCLLWVGGYLALLGYHNNLQPRYYLVPAVAATMLVAMGLEELLQISSLSARRMAAAAVAVCCALIVVPDVWEQMGFVLHPVYSYLEAARRIAGVVRADPGHSPWVLSVSGSDLALMTGLPSLNTEFSTLDLDQLIARYRPGWYATWNQTNDEDMQAIAPQYRLTRVGEFPAMDDPDRDLLILYRLDPVGNAPYAERKR